MGWPLRLLGPVCALLLAGSALSAQSPAEEESPLVEKIEFRGVEDVSTGELLEAIVTEETTCRSLVLRPFCAIPWWFDRSRFFVIKRYLDRAELPLDELRIRVALWRRGWRDSEVSSSVESADDGVKVIFTVDQGPATRIGALTVDQTRPVLSEERIAELDLPPEGTPLDLIEVDSARLRIRDLLWERAYSNAEVRDSILPLDSLQAAVEFAVETGSRTTVDEIVIRGNEKISERTIRRIFEARPGDLYRRSDVLEGQRRLYRSSLFRRTLIDVPNEADTAKRVVITVEEAPLRAVRAGVGVNTVDFVQTQAEYTRFNWLGGARRLDLRASVGNLLAPQLYDTPLFGDAVPQGIGEVEDAFLRPTWQLAAELTQPFLFSSRNSLGLTLFAQRRSVLGIVIDRGYGASASVTRRLAEDVPASLLYRFEQTTVEAGDVYYCLNFGVCRASTIDALRGSHALSPLGARISAVRVDDPLAPRSGYTAELNVEHASEFTLSDYRYNRVSGETVRYLPLGPGVLAGRIRAGWVRPTEGTAEALGIGGTTDAILHPRKRFYAGGARSVRGYGENQLGPRILTIAPGALLLPDSAGTPLCTAASLADGSCDPSSVAVGEFQPRPLGGNSVIEGSIEYRFPLIGPLGGAAFIDAATVGDRNLNVPPGARSAVTPGFGLRFLSPVGPIRLDLGIRPTLEEELPVVTQITDEDGEFRLVQLNANRLYDPVEDGGSWSQIFNRLQLHLSIGEAF